jgi:hypothetical protein
MNPLFSQINQQTMDLVNQTMSKTRMSKSGITTTTPGLVGYELQAPSKHLYPVLSPLRNRIARTMAPVGSLACNWRALTGINTANVKASVAFGTRNSAITYTEVNKAATYKTWGLEDLIDFEAVWLSRGFEDVRALSAMTTLQATMIEEEKLILGGVSSGSTFGVPSTPTSARVGSAGGTWTSTDNVYCKVVALPTYGYNNSNKADLTVALGDHSSLSLVATQALTAQTDSVTFTVAPVLGAVAYAWFIGEGSSEPADSSKKLGAISTVPSATFLLNPATGLAASTISADTSGDANAYDGILQQVSGIQGTNTFTTLDATNASGTLKQLSGGTAAPNSFFYDMVSSTTALGTQLTSDGAGGIVEFDAILKAMWDLARIGPSLCIMNSQEARSVTKLLAGNNTGVGIRIPVASGSKEMIGGLFYMGYQNKFTSAAMTPGNPDVVPFLVHPYMAPGTILFHSEQIPYPNPNVANVLEIELQSEYADYDFAMTTRQFPHGVYAMGVLKDYFPGGAGVIRSIKPT